MRLFLSVIVILFLISDGLFYSSNQCKANIATHTSSISQDEHIHFLVMMNDTGAWYYRIFDDGKVIINQTHIPAISGVVAFQDSSQAAQVAQLMSRKLSHGVFPPGVTKGELDSLKIVY